MTDAVAEALRSTCILATIRFRSLGLGRTDKEASRTTNLDNHASDAAGRVVVNRLAGITSYHKNIQAAQRDAQGELYSLSMPYGQDPGWRILPNEHFERLLARLNIHKRAFDKAMSQLELNADRIIAQAKQNLGTYSVAPPTKEEMVSAYGMQTEFREFPAGDFKHIPEQSRLSLMRHAEKRLSQAYEMAQNDTLGRVVAAIEPFVERMEAYDKREKEIAAGQDPGRTGVFRDSLVENLVHLEKMLSSFNVVGDPRFVHLQERLAVMLAKPDDLRKSPEKRDTAKRVGYELLDTIRDWMPRNT